MRSYVAAACVAGLSGFANAELLRVVFDGVVDELDVIDFVSTPYFNNVAVGDAFRHEFHYLIDPTPRSGGSSVHVQLVSMTMSVGGEVFVDNDIAPGDQNIDTSTGSSGNSSQLFGFVGSVTTFGSLRFSFNFTSLSGTELIDELNQTGIINTDLVDRVSTAGGVIGQTAWGGDIDDFTVTIVPSPPVITPVVCGMLLTCRRQRKNASS